MRQAEPEQILVQVGSPAAPGDEMMWLPGRRASTSIDLAARMEAAIRPQQIRGHDPERLGEREPVHAVSPHDAPSSGSPGRTAEFRGPKVSGRLILPLFFTVPLIAPARS